MKTGQGQACETVQSCACQPGSQSLSGSTGACEGSETCQEFSPLCTVRCTGPLMVAFLLVIALKLVRPADPEVGTKVKLVMQS